MNRRQFLKLIPIGFAVLGLRGISGPKIVSRTALRSKPMTKEMLREGIEELIKLSHKPPLYCDFAGNLIPPARDPIETELKKRMDKIIEYE